MDRRVEFSTMCSLNKVNVKVNFVATIEVGQQSGRPIFKNITSFFKFNQFAN